MQPEPFILFADEIASAKEAAESLRARGYRGRPVVLALPSAWCQCATIDLTTLKTARDRRAWVYRLEEQLPLAAENVTADLAAPRGKTGGRGLGVCAETERLKSLVTSLEESGVRITTIAPAALLAAQSIKTPEPGILLLASRDGTDATADVIAIERGLPVAWAWSGGDEQDIRLQVELASSQMAPQPLPPVVNKIERSISELATATARGIVAGRVRPWIDLRRGALSPRDRLGTHRRAINFTLASAALLLLAVTFAAAVHGARYASDARRSEQAMIDAFRAQFPGWPVPANVRAVVESELRRRTEEGPTAASGAAASSMRAIIAAIPAEVHLAVDSMAFDSRAFEINGRVNQQSDVEVLAAAARSAGFEVAPPQSHRAADGTWSFTISGNRRSGAPAVATGAQTRL
jgi:type II secretion system protein L